MKSLSLASVKKLFSKQNMKALMIVIVLLFALMVVTQFSARSLEGFEANSSNFDSTLGTSGKKLVLFYADWCPHCTSFKPTWQEVSESVNTSSETKMISIDVGDKSSESDKLMQEYNVSGFPTIVLVDQSNQQKSLEVYEGSRDKSALQAYVSEKL